MYSNNCLVSPDRPNNPWHPAISATSYSVSLISPAHGNNVTRQATVRAIYNGPYCLWDTKDLQPEGGRFLLKRTAKSD